MDRGLVWRFLRGVVGRLKKVRVRREEEKNRSWPVNADLKLDKEKLRYEGNGGRISTFLRFILEI